MTAPASRLAAQQSNCVRMSARGNVSPDGVGRCAFVALNPIAKLVKIRRTLYNNIYFQIYLDQPSALKIKVTETPTFEQNLQSFFFSLSLLTQFVAQLLSFYWYYIQLFLYMSGVSFVLSSACHVLTFDLQTMFLYIFCCKIYDLCCNRFQCHQFVSYNHQIERLRKCFS